MADTEHFGWTKPTVGGDAGAWGTILNAALDDIDDDLFDVKATADGALQKAGGTMTGNLRLRTTTANRVNLGNVSGTVTLDFSNANAWMATVTGNTTITLANVPSGVAVGGVLRLTNGGSRSVIFPSAFKWAGGTRPTLTANGVDLIAFISLDGGSTFQAAALLNAS